VFEDTICVYNWEIYYETGERRTALLCEDVLLEKGRGEEGEGWWMSIKGGLTTIEILTTGYLYPRGLKGINSTQR
jgi:hypothetical protein